MSFQVQLIHNQLVRTGRPNFISSTLKGMVVISGVQDRRHILHGAAQISDVLITSFNCILRQYGTDRLVQLLDERLRNFELQGIKSSLGVRATLIVKVKKVITIAFSLKRNLVVGIAVQNQGIEKARGSIHVIKNKLDEYCSIDFRSFQEVKAKTLELIVDSLNGSGNGEVARYRVWILNILKDSVNEITDVVTTVRVLDDFEFSCTLDIIHEGTTREQNIWGITMANRLQEVIRNQDDAAIFAILL